MDRSRRPASPPEHDPVLREEVRELEEFAARKRRSAGWHIIWSVLGVSPAAVVPMVMGFEQMGIVAVAVLSVLVGGTELWKAGRDRRDAEAADRRVADLLGDR